MLAGEGVAPPVPVAYRVRHSGLCPGITPAGLFEGDAGSLFNRGKDLPISLEFQIVIVEPCLYQHAEFAEVALV